MSVYIERKSIRNLYSCLNPNDRVLVGQVLIDIDAIPPAEVIPKGSDEASLAYAEGWKNGEEAERSRRPKGEQIAIGAVCEVICKHCIKANGHCQHHWKCPLLTEIAKLIEPKDEPQTLKCFKSDKYKSCEYVGKCDNHICLKALSEGEKRAKTEPQTERSE